MKTLAILSLITILYKPEHVQRRQGILIRDEKGKIEFKPLEEWKDYELKTAGDSVYQFKVY